jgi:hypothetical protein
MQKQATARARQQQLDQVLRQWDRADDIGAAVKSLRTESQEKRAEADRGGEPQGAEGRGTGCKGLNVPGPRDYTTGTDMALANLSGGLCYWPDCPERRPPVTDPSSSVERCPVPRAGQARGTVPSSRCPARGQPVRAVPFWQGGHRAVPAHGFGRVLQPGPAPGRADLTGRAESRVDACGPGREASPPRRPATGPAASTPGNGGVICPAGGGRGRRGGGWSWCDREHQQRLAVHLVGGDFHHRCGGTAWRMGWAR